MQAVLDAPVVTGDGAEALGGEGRAEQVIGGLGGGLAGALSAAGELADSRQAGPAVVAEPGNVARHQGGAGLDAAMIGVDGGVGAVGLDPRIVEEQADVGMQTALVALERQDIVAAP